MAKQVLAIGLDPIYVDLSGHPEFTADLVRTFIETQLERVRALGDDWRGPARFKTTVVI